MTWFQQTRWGKFGTVMLGAGYTLLLLIAAFLALGGGIPIAALGFVVLALYVGGQTIKAAFFLYWDIRHRIAP
jgi:hypothetical protein